MLSDISLWLEERGLTTEELITEAVRKSSIGERKKIRREFDELLRNARKSAELEPKNSSFSFLASSSFRGERCCAHPNCRMKKGPRLIEFGALYADRLHVPFDTGSMQDKGYLLEGSLRMAHNLRPLIDNDIVKPSVGALHLCEKCRHKLLGADSELGAVAKTLQLAHVSEFEASVRMANRQGRQILIMTVTGPADYLESSCMTFESRDLRNIDLAEGVERQLTTQEIIDLKILDRVFFYSVRDLVLQQSYKEFDDAVYLSDLPSETEFFRAARKETEPEAWQTAVLQKLTHEIPVFADVRVEHLIALRNEEEFAFRNYRNALDRAIRVYPSGGDPDRAAKQIWNEQIRPEVEKLQSKAHQIKSSFGRTLISRAIPTSMIIGVGILGSRIPATLAHAIDLAAGCSLVKDMLPSRPGSVKTQLASEDFYFLLRASEN